MIMNNKLKDMQNELFYYCGIYSGLKNVLDSCNEVIEKNPEVFTDEIMKHKLLKETLEKILETTVTKLKNEFSVDINNI